MPEEEPCAKPKPERVPFGWQFWVFQIVLIAILVAFSIYSTCKQKKKADQIRTISSLRQIGLAFVEFENEFSSYPSEATARLVIQRFPKQGHNLSGSSNALFRQLFAAELTQSEAMFYAKVPGVRKPDGDITPGELLEKGEVGFAYITGLSSTGSPARPIAFAPVIPGTKQFDPKPFEGKAVFLRSDNSVTSLPIGKDGRVILYGIDILSAENPIWDGKSPDIRYPE